MGATDNNFKQHIREIHKKHTFSESDLSMKTPDEVILHTLLNYYSRMYDEGLSSSVSSVCVGGGTAPTEKFWGNKLGQIYLFSKVITLNV